MLIDSLLSDKLLYWKKFWNILIRATLRYACQMTKAVKASGKYLLLLIVLL